jgi:hypothetical protein
LIAGCVPSAQRNRNARTPDALRRSGFANPEIIAAGPYGDQLDAESVKTVLLGELFENLLAVPMDEGWVATDKAKEERAKWLGP